MTDESEKGFGPWSRVPQWDGSPQTWRKFKRDVSWWISSMDLTSTVKYNLAARFLMRQEGIARQRGEEFLPKDLEVPPRVKITDPDTGEEFEDTDTPLDYLYGVNRLMRAWEEMNGRTALDKRGELRQAFYMDLARRAGERVSEFCTRYRSLVADLRAEGVVIADGELGWFLRQKMGLDPLRKQLLDTSLQGKEDYSVIETEILRLFRDLHENDPLSRRLEARQPLTIRRMFAASRGHQSGGSSAASTSSRFSSSSSWTRPPSVKSGSQARQANVTETLEEVGEEEPADNESEEPVGQLDEVLQAEAEILACELEEAEQEGIDPELIQDLESGIEAAAETLVTMREARQTLASVRKDRGYGKADGGKGVGKKSSAQTAVRKKSGQHPCFDCNGTGHWAGDPECPTPGAGAGRKSNVKKPAKQVRITEAEHSASVTEVASGLPLHDVLTVEETPLDHDVLAVSCNLGVLDLEHALAQNTSRSALVTSSSTQLPPDKELVGALDSACNRTCTGPIWLNQYLEVLKKAPKFVQDLIHCEDESENFRFGNNGVVPSVQRWRLPALIGQTVVCIWVSLVPIGTLGCLIGRDFMEAVGAILDFTRRTMTCSLFPSGVLHLRQMVAGHFMLDMLPPKAEDWGAPAQSRWRRVGQDGIVELQMNVKTWARHKMNSRTGKHREHEHQLTEQAVRASAFTGASSSVHDALLSHCVCPDSTSAAGDSAQGALCSELGECNAEQWQPRKRPKCRPMAPSGSAASTTCRMASPRPRSLAGATARVALLAISLSIGAVLQGLGRSSEDYESGLHLAPTPFEPGSVQDDPWASWGLFAPARPRGLQASISGGWTSAEYGWFSQWLSWSEASSSTSSSTTSSRRSSGASCGWESRGHDKVHDWSSWRPSNKEGRSTQVGCPPSCPRCRECDCQHPEEQAHPRSGHTDGRTSRRCGFGSRAPGPTMGQSTFEVLTVSSESKGSSKGRDVGPSAPRIRSTSPRSDDWVWRAHASARRGDGRDPVRDGVQDQRGGIPGADARKDGSSTRALGSPDGQTVRSACPGAEHVNEKDFGFTWSKRPKAGVSQMISQAWDRHCRDRVAVSKDKFEVFEVMMEQWNKEVKDGLNETFLTQIELGAEPSVMEIYTDTEPIASEARRRGLRAAQSMTLSSGWDFKDATTREKALQWIRRVRPYAIILAFPCNPWSVLLNLNSKVDIQRLRDEAVVLVEFAIQVARLQLDSGRHFLMENPLSSGAWKLEQMLEFLTDPRVRSIVVDMCRFGLCDKDGSLHKKPTKLVSSSQALISRMMQKRCTGDHEHAPVIGGNKVTRPAGHYTQSFAKEVISSFQDQFDLETTMIQAHESLVVDKADSLIAADPLSSDDEVQVAPEVGEIKIPASIRSAVQRLHVNTGHRSGRRLARALVLCGAPREAILAAKNLSCDICQERRAPKARRPATLPAIKDVGAQLHIDILMVEDAFKQVYPVLHATDKVSRYQLAAIVPNKSTKAVTDFLTLHWLPLLGTPQIIIADQGREFISHEFEEWCGSRNIFLHHIAVQAPWQNGIAERSGATLKAIIGALVRVHSIGGSGDMALAVAEATAAYNSDVNEEGVSPVQAVTGRQTAAQGDVLAGVGNRLAEHSLIENKPSLARQVALRETARVAMVRMHFSRSLRRAELARARSTTHVDPPQPGDLCYFWRESKYNPKKKDGSFRRRKLELRRWFGPAMMVALENGKGGEVGANAFLSFRGQLTKCALEHIRKASSLEQISFDAWEEAIKDVVKAAGNDVEVSLDAADEVPLPGDLEDDEPELLDEDFNEPSVPVQPLEGRRQDEVVSRLEDAPPLTVPEVVAAIQPPSAQGSSRATSVVPSTETSRRSSLNVGDGGIPTAQPGTPVPELITDVGRRNVLQDQIERARVLQQPSSPRPPGEKRAASQEPDRSSASAGGHPEVVEIDPASPQPAFEALEFTWEQLCNIADCESTHPLVRLQAMAEQDRRAPLECLECDHGSWDGRWSFMCQKDWELMQELGEMLPNGAEHDALNVQASRKEYHWKGLSAEDKKGFTEAAIKGWSVYIDNGALEILDMKTSGEVRRQLTRDKALDKILRPRFVLTDKHDGLRTEDHWLPRKYSARLVVPGFRDRSNLEGQIRRDAPTGSRIAQHLLFCVAASKPMWLLLSGDIKSAFMKGDVFEDETRLLFICETDPNAGPMIPLKPGQLARVRKAVFGLADAPREWWLKLSRSLAESNWHRMILDGAAWLLWAEDVDFSKPCMSKLKGMIVAHVDDLLFIGDADAVESFDHIGTVLGFGSREEQNFVWCGKRIRRADDKTIRLSMVEYHQNLKEIYVSKARRNEPTDELTPGETRQLKALLGSFQWLVAQLRFDMAFPVSSIQGEKPTVATLLRANGLLRQFQQDCGFELIFRPIDLSTCGILVVCDAALGNVTIHGCVEAPVLKKVYSQSCYFVLIADEALMSGRLGRFNILDARSHRIPRVCRSTYSAETLGTEEGFDIGILCRGFLASVRGYNVLGKASEPALGMVNMQVVVDAKDVFDKGNSDTSTYGSQKSLAFTVSWMRSQLRKPRTTLKWTSTENMWVDGGTKLMDLTHLRRIMLSGEWSVSYCPKFVKQVYKTAKTKPTTRSLTELPGEPMSPQDPLLNHLMKLGEQRGWHFQNNIGVHVAFNAKSFRTPEPRFSAEMFPCRSTFARFERFSGQYEWRQLERAVKYSGLANQHALFGGNAPILVTLFHCGDGSSLDDMQCNKEIGRNVN